MTRLFEMAVGCVLFLTLIEVSRNGEPKIYDFANYLQTFGLIGFGYFASGFLILTLFFSFLLRERYVLLSFVNLASFLAASILTSVIGVSFEGGVLVYSAHGILIVVSSLIFGALFGALSKE